MSFDYDTMENIGLNFGKRVHYGFKITKGVILILYNFIYDFFMLSKTHYNKTKNIVSYSVKNNSVIFPGDNVSINDYEGELENKWLLSNMKVKDESIDRNDEYVYILKHVSNKSIVSKQLLDNITLLE